MADTTNQTTVPLAQIAKVLGELAPSADAARATALDTLGALRAARGAQLTRERVRMATVAFPDHPFLARLDQSIQANDTFGKVVAEHAAQARSGIPQVDPAAWIVYGRVRDAHLNPVAKATVGLADEKGSWQRQWPTVESGAGGGYILRLPVASAGPGGTQPAAPAVFLVVLDAAKGQVLLLDTEKLSPRAGAVDARDLSLPGPATAVPSASIGPRRNAPGKAPAGKKKG